MFRPTTILLLVTLTVSFQVAHAQFDFGNRFPWDRFPRPGRFPGFGPFPRFPERPPFIRPPFIRPPPNFNGNSLESALRVVCANGSRTAEARAQAVNCTSCFMDNFGMTRWGLTTRTPNYAAARQCMRDLPLSELAACADLIPVNGSTNTNRNALSNFKICLESLFLAERVKLCLDTGSDFGRCLLNGRQTNTNGGSVTRNPVTEEPSATSPRVTSESPNISNPDSSSNNTDTSTTGSSSNNADTSTIDSSSNNTDTANPSTESGVVTSIVG